MSWISVPDHFVSDVIPKIFRYFGSFNILHIHLGDPANVDLQPACDQGTFVQ